jgi:hypothetical protein
MCAMRELQANWEVFSKLIDQVSASQEEHINSHILEYIKQNIILLNDIFSVSLYHLNKLQKVKSANDVICAQARFSSECHFHKRMSFVTRRCQWVIGDMK